MGKKKLYSDVSAEKLTVALMANYAGRVGGLPTLDRDVQLQLQAMARAKANYWRAKFDPYHQLNIAVSELLAREDVSFTLRGVVMGLARAIAKCWAHNSHDSATVCEETYLTKLRDLTLSGTLVEDIRNLARGTGLAISTMYHLAPSRLGGGEV